MSRGSPRRRFARRTRTVALSSFVFLLTTVAGTVAWDGPCSQRANAQDSPTREASVDPLPAAIRAHMTKQDELLDAGETAELLSMSKAQAQDGTPDGLYLLGRAYGMLADRARRENKNDAYLKNLDLAKDTFGRAQEVGGMLYAPALVGLARCAWIERDLELAAKHLKQALQIDRHFKMAVLELAQVQWNRNLRGEAEDVLHNFLSEHSKDIQARMLLGLLRHRRKQWDKAEREFRTVVEQDPQHVAARKLLSWTLTFQQKFDAAAEQLEYLRKLDPKDTETYWLLYRVLKQLNDKEKAVGVLEDLVRNCPGTEEATRAENTLEAIRKDPAYFRRTGRPTRDVLVNDLESPEPEVVIRALNRMRSMSWDRLPATVYRLLDPVAAKEDVRLASMRLIGAAGNAGVLPVLEEILHHPKFADPSIAVRREAARAVAGLKTEASIVVLYRMLGSTNADIREAGVAGLADRTGKYFRERLETATPDADWPAELAQYRAWWKTASASIAQRRSIRAWFAFIDGSPVSKRRVGRYFLDAMNDPLPTAITWRVAYDGFRKVTGKSFGAESGTVDAETRERIRQEAVAWFEANVTNAKKPDSSPDSDPPR